MRYRVKDGDTGYGDTAFEWDIWLSDERALVVSGILSVKMFYESDDYSRGSWLPEGWELEELDIPYDEHGNFWKSDDRKEIAICLALMEQWWPELHKEIDRWAEIESKELAESPPNDWDF